MERLFPKIYKELSMSVEKMPVDGWSPVQPFAGLVINFNVTTRLHRDHKDDKICLVMVIKDDNCVGGELCFYEPGLVMKLRSGDIVIFRSSGISHFNLHFKGKRISLVFSSDADILRWLANSNGWLWNDFYKDGDRGMPGGRIYNKK